MSSLKRKWNLFTQLAWVVRTWHFIQLAVPIVLAGYTAFAAVTEQLPRAQLITLSVLSLAGGLLSINQLRMLIGVPIAVTSRESFAHGLNYGGIHVAYAPNDPNATLQIGVLFTNSARAPLKYEVERMDVIVGTTTLPQKTYTNRGGVIPLMGSRLFRDASFSMQVIRPLIGGKHTGSAEIVVLYGPVDSEPTRRFRFKLLLSIDIQANSVSIADVLELEKDEAWIPD